MFGKHESRIGKNFFTMEPEAPYGIQEMGQTSVVSRFPNLSKYQGHLFFQPVHTKVIFRPIYPQLSSKFGAYLLIFFKIQGPTHTSSVFVQFWPS